MVLSLGILVNTFINTKVAAAASVPPKLPQVCSVSITSPSDGSKVNPNQSLTVKYSVSCSSGRWIRTRVYLVSSGDSYIVYNPSSATSWTYQPAGTRNYYVTYPASGLLNAKKSQNPAYLYVELHEYAQGDDEPPKANEKPIHMTRDYIKIYFLEKYSCNKSTWQCYEDSNGSYSSLSDCQAQCKAPRYECNSSTWQCYEKSNGTYSSLSSCQNNCQAPAPRYECNTSTWQCYQKSNGSYSSLAQCQSSCYNQTPPPDPIRYECNTSTWQCYQSSNGSYSSLAQCQSSCYNQTPPPDPIRYECNTSTWQCYQSSNGSYSSLASCQCSCYNQTPPPDPVRYECNQSTWQCYQSSNGAYSSLSSCQNNCQAPAPRYECNTSTWQCYQSSNGSYSSLAQCQNNCIQSTPKFDFTLTNSGNIVVTKPSSGSITGSNTITATLVSGNSQEVNFSQSGLPNGVSAQPLAACSPTCSRSNILTVSNSSPTGTFPITVTATAANITRTTTYNLIIQENSQSLTASCWASPNPAKINQSVIFYSYVTGGNGNYYYSWTGAASGNSSNVTQYFNSNGTHWAYLEVTDSNGNKANTSCQVLVEGSPAPTLTLWADKYVINNGESTYLRWSSANASYCQAADGWSGTKSTSGYELVSPSSQTTYSLTCYNQNGSITQGLVIYVNSTSNNLSVTKLGRNLSGGDRAYSKVVRLTAGDVVEFYINITAGSARDLTNVTVKDILPPALSYINGSTKVDGVTYSDGITGSGLNLGTLNRNTSRVITFEARSVNPGLTLTQTNIAEVTANGETAIRDSASVTFGLVAGAATVNTGPEDTIGIILFTSLGVAGTGWSYLKFTPKGQSFMARYEEKMRARKLSKIRQEFKD